MFRKRAMREVQTLKIMPIPTITLKEASWERQLKIGKYLIYTIEEEDEHEDDESTRQQRAKNHFCLIR